MQRPCEQFLAGAAVAEQQDGSARRGNLLDRAPKTAHRIADADNSLESHGACLLTQTPVFFFKLANAKRASHHDRQDSGIQGLVIKICGAEAHGGHRQLARIVLGHGDDLGVWREIQNLPQQFEALSCDSRLAGRAQIEQHDVGLDAAHQHERLLRGLAGGDIEIGEDFLELTPERAVVLENQQLAPVAFGRRRRSCGQSRHQHTPFPLANPAFFSAPPAP